MVGADTFAVLAVLAVLAVMAVAPVRLLAGRLHGLATDGAAAWTTHCRRRRCLGLSGLEAARRHQMPVCGGP